MLERSFASVAMIATCGAGPERAALNAGASSYGVRLSTGWVQLRGAFRYFFHFAADWRASCLVATMDRGTAMETKLNGRAARSSTQAER